MIIPRDYDSHEDTGRTLLLLGMVMLQVNVCNVYNLGTVLCTEV